jgi:hypothetical protein
MRASQYGAPTTSTAISSKLYSAIATIWTTSGTSPRSTTTHYHGTSEEVSLACMNSHRKQPRLRSSLTSRANVTRAFRTMVFRTAIAATLLAPVAARAADHKGPPPAKPAAEYAANDTHPDEHVTVAAEPCDDPKQCSFFRLAYVEHGLLPVRVIFTNDSDRALSLDDARMQFISANNDKIPAATEDDINRRIFTIHSAQPIHVPFDPIPIHRTPVDKKVSQDDNDFGFSGTVVNAHSTLAGYLFYDIKDLDDPALKHAELYVKQVHTLDGKHELFAFTIPFDKWLAANPDAPSNHPQR